jgi:GAF domain-containing protein
MAKKTSPIEKSIKKTASKAEDRGAEKAVSETASRRRSNGSQKTDRKPLAAKRVRKEISQKRPSAQQQLIQREAELEVINSVQQGLAAKLDFQAIVDLVGETLRGMISADTFGIALYDSATGLVSYPYVVVQNQRVSLAVDQPSGISGHILKTGETVVLNRDFVEKAKRYKSTLVAGDAFPKSGVYVPIKVGTEIVGGITAQNYQREDAYPQSVVRLLEIVAANMGTALENARLFDETQRLFKAEQERVTELEIINSIQQGLAAELDFQAIVDLVGDKLREVLKTPDLVINWYEQEGNLLHYLYVYEHGKRLATTVRQPTPNGIFERMIKTRQPVVLNTIAEQAQIAGGAMPGTEVGKSIIAVPIMSGDSLLGAIGLENHERENAYGASELRLLTTIAASLGTALQNARLFDETQHRNAELAIINSVQSALASKLDYMGVIEAVGDKLRQIFPNESLVGIGIADRERNLT